ncbi:chemotaxis protein CheW [Acidisoma silvae]|uniref:Chemotaxis protein CheW n=1 Tax=Acidisoma silvae TaxID=2802396 RepID=A0A964DZ76_9PROT|nr:chemotaxis protein CheW [Acidisoma silvae]MCB8876195.1 chemotaxis protein CheW [Acidisoma silvae]
MNRQEERAALILDRRTRALAERKDGQGQTQALRALIIASVGSNLLGFDVAEVAAVIPFEGCARMPVSDPAVLGVVGRAGRFYSVIGLARVVTQPAGEAGGPAPAPAHLLLLRGSAPHMALAVDRVLGRFDLAGDTTFDLDGQWVALFDPESLRRRFGRASAGGHP